MLRTQISRRKVPLKSALPIRPVNPEEALRQQKLRVLSTPTMTLSSYVLDVISPRVLPKLSPTWRRVSERELRVLAESTLGSRPLNAITKVNIWEWWSDHEGRGFPTAANKQRQWLRQVMRMACDHDLIVKDPSLKIKRMKEPRNRVRWLTDEQRAAILHDCSITYPNPRLFRYIWLAMHTIVRRGSLLHVEKQDIDLASGTITYRHMKGGRPPLVVPLVPECLDQVRGWLAEPGPLLHQYTDIESVSQGFRRIVRRLKINGPGAPNGDFRFHDLRHDMATRLVSAGYNLKVIMDLAGWESMEMVGRYGHTKDDVKVAALTTALAKKAAQNV